MTRHDPRISLAQMFDHAQEAIQMAAGFTREDLEANRMLILALTRLLEIIGESASRVPEEVRLEYGDIPWRNIIGNRNRLIHGYDKVDLDILWAIVQQDLPALLVALQK